MHLFIHRGIGNAFSLNIKMGNTKSTPTALPSTESLNIIINNILNEKNTFINPEYNFLSEVVCDQYQIVFEEELAKQLKVELSEYGSTIFLLPRKKISRVPKSEICQRISSHYVRILYILTLIKHIYNVENNGDNSFSGILFRNVVIDDDFIHIKYCNSEQFDPFDSTTKRRFNLNKLPGFRFLIQYVLDRNEGKAFMGLIRAMFSRSSRRSIQTQICMAFGDGNISKEEMVMLSYMFKRHYGETLQCRNISLPAQAPTSPEHNAHAYVNEPLIKIEPFNPVLDARYCNLVDEKKYIPKSSEKGKALLIAYNQMHSHYQKNLKDIEALIKEVAHCEGGTWVLNDLSSTKLDEIVGHTKTLVRKYIFQTLFDYHYMLDIARKNP
jgi:hypothetical protein